jgi:hypothetical protein
VASKKQQETFLKLLASKYIEGDKLFNGSQLNEKKKKKKTQIRERFSLLWTLSFFLFLTRQCGHGGNTAHVVVVTGHPDVTIHTPVGAVERGRQKK